MIIWQEKNLHTQTHAYTYTYTINKRIEKKETVSLVEGKSRKKKESFTLVIMQGQFTQK
jgi:hypothetical protein